MCLYLLVVTVTAACGAKTDLDVSGDAGVAAQEPAGTIAAIGAGGDYACALARNGDLWCWGDNNRRQLGDGTHIERHVPVRTVGLVETSSFSTGFTHACAITRDGQAFCWGHNYAGQLGTTHSRLGSLEAEPKPVHGLTTVERVSAGAGHTCALADGRQFFCWGDNEHGQLGTHTRVDSQVPVPVRGIGTGVDVCAGVAHSCGVVSSGNVYCWGDNGYGQLGVEGPERLEPSRVPGVIRASALTCGGGFTCALVGDGAVSCWGTNMAGTLGRGTWSPTEEPGRVSLSERASFISAGVGHACAVGRSGTVWCWGGNGLGEVGTDARLEALPVAVHGLTAAAVAGGSSLTCALHRTGGVSCWGSNGRGQLGDGTTESRPFPRPVVGLP